MPLELLLPIASSSYVRVASRSQGTNIETKIFNFRWFLALLTEMSFTTPHYYPKYEVWAIEFFCGRIPLKSCQNCLFVLDDLLDFWPYLQLICTREIVLGVRQKLFEVQTTFKSSSELTFLNSNFSFLNRRIGHVIMV